MNIKKNHHTVWKSTADLSKKYNSLNIIFTRLAMLDHIWKHLTGEKSKFWKLYGVNAVGGCIYVQVRLSVARNELIGRRDFLIKELNKHFDKPWIKKIEIVKDLGAIHD